MRGVALDAAATSRCRRRVHLDHDPAAAGSPRAQPDPALQQRRADAAEHRVRIGERLAAATGPGLARGARAPGAPRSGSRPPPPRWPPSAPLIWGAVLPDATAPAAAAGPSCWSGCRSGGYVPVIVVRHRITDPGEGALTAPLPEPWPQRARPDPQRRVRSQPRDLLRLAHLNRMLHAAGWAARPRPTGSPSTAA